MTHNELLAKIDTLEARYTDYPNYLALRTVVELHKSNDDGLTCNECTASETEWYPCPTIQAIEKELG